MRAVKLLLGGLLALGVFGVAASSTKAGATSPSNRTSCSGTLSAPGLLSGTYSGDVTVTGFCIADGPPTLIRGDPSAAAGGTLTGQNTISRDGTASGALALIVHASYSKGDVRQTGGGGGLSCNPPTTGVFALMHSPVFSDYENNTISGDLKVTGVHSCYFGGLRNSVKGDLSYTNNTFGDPDASEVLTNVVSGDIACSGNSPVVHYGDSAGMPNRAHEASGECSFTAMQPNPAPSGPLAPITVRK